MDGALFNSLATAINMFNIYQKKPYPIQGIVWDETKQTRDFLISKGMNFCRSEGHADNPDLCKNLTIRMSFSDSRIDVKKGDFLYKSSMGDILHVPKEVFELTYEPYKE